MASCRVPFHKGACRLSVGVVRNGKKSADVLVQTEKTFECTFMDTFTYGLCGLIPCGLMFDLFSAR